MERFKAPIVAFTLLALVASPSNVMAGPFGLFKWCKRKTTHCPPPECPPIRCEIQTGGPRTTTRCRAWVFGDNCYAKSEWHEGSIANCNALKATALTEARMRAGVDGCVERSNYQECEDFCPPATVVGFSGEPCARKWQVTYKICCCNGHLIDIPFCHEDLEHAKFAAKIIALDHAQEDCGGRIRWCRWVVRCVPVSQCNN